MNERAAKILKIAIGTVIVAGIIAGAVVFVCKNEKARNAISDFADKCKMKKNSFTTNISKPATKTAIATSADHITAKN